MLLRKVKATAILSFSLFFSVYGQEDKWNTVNNRFSPQSSPLREKIFSEFSEKGKLLSNDSIVQVNVKKGRDGVNHEYYQQFHEGVPVENAFVAFHYLNRKVIGFNGNTYSGYFGELSASILPADAISRAIQEIGAEEYSWENEEFMKLVNDHPARKDSVVFFPKPILTWISDGYGVQELSYKLEIQSVVPQGRHTVFVSALTGNILHHIENTQTTVGGNCQTMHHGTQLIEFDQTPSLDYQLTDTSRNIETYLLPNGQTNYLNGYIPTSNVTNWSNLTGNDKAALDVHWASELVYDFLLSKGIDSYDDNSAPIISYANYGNTYNSSNNAFWNGFFLTYGNGGSATFPAPIVTLDVVAHEYAHALTEHFGGGLTYFGESGAINESISDIIAAAIEIQVNGSTLYNGVMTNEWIISDLNGMGIRDMSNPNSFNQPDTYGGTNWASPTSSYDNGGVHINSGIGNYWFYLLCSGGNGTNDLSYTYNVSPIGVDIALEVVLNSYAYMNSNASYEDFREATILAASVLYNDCAITEQIIEAWKAVGVEGLSDDCGVFVQIEATNTQQCAGNVHTYTNVYANSPSHSYQWTLDGLPVTMPITIPSAGVSILSLTATNTTTGAAVTDEREIYISDCVPIESNHQTWYFGRHCGFDFSSGIAVPITYPGISFETTHCYSDQNELCYYIASAVDSNGGGSSGYSCVLFDQNHNVIADLAPLITSSFYMGESAPNPYETNGHKYVNTFINGSFDSYGGVGESGLYRLTMDVIDPLNPSLIDFSPVSIPAGLSQDPGGATSVGEHTFVIPGCSPYIYWILAGLDGGSPGGGGSILYKLDYGAATGSEQGVLSHHISYASVGQSSAYIRVSPDGQTCILNGRVHTFDRELGTLTFVQSIVPSGTFGTEYTALFKGVFSPSSQFFYVTEGHRIYQYDLYASDIYASKTLVGELENLVPNSTNYLRMSPGPDDKIYISSIGEALIGYPAPGLQRAGYISVMNKPNEKELNGEVQLNEFAYRFEPASNNPYYIDFPSHRDIPLVTEESPLSVSYIQSNCNDFTFKAPSCKPFYTWVFGDGDTLSLTDQCQVNHTYSSPGTYTLSLSSNVNGVDTTVYLSIVVGIADSINILGDSTICGQIFTYVQAPSGYASYSWSVISGMASLSYPNEQSTGVTWTSDGQVTLELTVVHDNGCSKTTTRTFEVISGDTPPSLDVLNIDFTTNCDTIPATPTATGKCGEIIYGTTNAQFPVTSAGVTTIVWTFEDADGNEITQTQLVDYQPLDLTVTQQDYILTAAPNYQYQWIDCANGTPILGETTQSFIATTNGEYAVIVSAGDCADTSNCIVINDAGLELLSGNPFVVYPNPSLGNFTVVFDEEAHVEVYSILGQIVFAQTGNEVDISHLSNGIYRLKIYSSNGELVAVEQLVKKGK
jgi:Zn-dependent metalloprotease